jgi:hypothetical protein
MRLDVQRVAQWCVAAPASHAQVLCPLAARLTARLSDRYEAQALLTLGLTLAKRDYAELGPVAVDADGYLHSLPARTSAPVLESIVAHALQLCTTQLGEREAVALIGEAWPDLDLGSA